MDCGREIGEAKEMTGSILINGKALETSSCVRLSLSWFVLVSPPSDLVIVVLDLCLVLCFSSNLFSSFLFSIFYSSFSNTVTSTPETATCILKGSWPHLCVQTETKSHLKGCEVL